MLQLRKTFCPVFLHDAIPKKTAVFDFFFKALYRDKKLCNYYKTQKADFQQTECADRVKIYYAHSPKKTRPQGVRVLRLV